MGAKTELVELRARLDRLEAENSELRREIESRSKRRALLGKAATIAAGLGGGLILARIMVFERRGR